MRDLHETCDLLESIGNYILRGLQLDTEFSLSFSDKISDHYAFTGFIGETPVHFGINGRGNAVHEYFPELLEKIKEHLSQDKNNEG